VMSHAERRTSFSSGQCTATGPVAAGADNSHERIRRAVPGHASTTVMQASDPDDRDRLIPRSQSLVTCRRHVPRQPQQRCCRHPRGPREEGAPCGRTEAPRGRP
jgi:hypothetical protein